MPSAGNSATRPSVDVQRSRSSPSAAISGAEDAIDNPMLITSTGDG